MYLETHKFITRRFNEADLDQVIAINRLCLPENYPESFFLYIFRSLPDGFRVCEIDDKIVAYTMSRIENGFSNHRRFKRVKKGHTISVAVLSDYRRQGVAQRLLVELYEVIKTEGAQEAFLEVRMSNLAAVNLYKKLDFHTIRELKHYYCDGESAWLMSKEL